jgi:hypothetical protein
MTQPVKNRRFNLTAYVRREYKLILGGGALGLVLALGVWLVALDELGARLATVGAFIAAILTPLVASVVNNFIVRREGEHEGTPPEKEDVRRDFLIIVAAALVALSVALVAIWLVPRGVQVAQEFAYHAFEEQPVKSDEITLTNNLHLRDGESATAVLPATRHRHLKITFKVENGTATTLCANAAMLRVSGAGGTAGPGAAGSELIIPIGDEASSGTTLKVQLAFLPETDPSCRLNLTVASATYYN